MPIGKAMLKAGVTLGDGIHLGTTAVIILGTIPGIMTITTGVGDGTTLGLTTMVGVGDGTIPITTTAGMQDGEPTTILTMAAIMAVAGIIIRMTTLAH